MAELPLAAMGWEEVVEVAVDAEVGGGGWTFVGGGCLRPGGWRLAGRCFLGVLRTQVQLGLRGDRRDARMEGNPG
jgi:hypothetical protein